MTQSCFPRKTKDSSSKKEDKKHLDALDRELKKYTLDLKKRRDAKLMDLLTGLKVKELRYAGEDKKLVRAGTNLTPERLEKIELDDLDVELDIVDETKVNNQVRKLFREVEERVVKHQEDLKKKKYKIVVGDELPPGIVQLAKVYVAKKRKLSVGDKIGGPVTVIKGLWRKLYR